MTERFFTPPHTIDIAPSTPLVFLEGPVQGAPDWQTPLAHTLLTARPDIAVASPRRTPEDQRYFLEDKEAASDQQVAWEFQARERAMDLGGIAMWWAARDFSDNTYPEGRVYAKTTSIELGEVWGWKRAHPGFPFAMGFDADFKASGSNSRGYIERNHRLRGLPVFHSIDVADSILAQLPRADA